MFLKYANIIFDLERADALKNSAGYLDALGGHCMWGTLRRMGPTWTTTPSRGGELDAERA